MRETRENRASCSFNAIRTQEGFTLVELIMVIVIVSILGVVVVPNLDFEGFNIRAGAEVVAADITQTQMDAMNSHQRLSITLATGASSYTYGQGLTRDLTMIHRNFMMGASQTITFNSLGEPVGLAAPVTITVVSGASSQSLTVEPVTGKVTVL